MNDLCAVYLMKPTNFTDGQLAIPENANGIPDILDEAEWGLRHLLAVQQKDGGVGTWIESTGHPGPGNLAERDPMRYAVSRATRGSSLAYAAHASLLARCHEVKRKRLKVLTDEEEVYWREPRDLPSALFIKAAINLHALTGDKAYMDALDAKKREIEEDLKKNEWRWFALVFAGERELGIPPQASKFMAEWERRLLNRAKDMLGQIDGAYAYRCPWWAPGKGYFSAMSWGNSHPLRRAQTLVAAHRIKGDDAYLRGAFAALDFHNGCNPVGTTLTSGLGQVYPVAFLDLPSYVDGIAEYVPGISASGVRLRVSPRADGNATAGQARSGEGRSRPARLLGDTVTLVNPNGLTMQQWI